MPMSHLSCWGEFLVNTVNLTCTYSCKKALIHVPTSNPNSNSDSPSWILMQWLLWSAMGFWGEHVCKSFSYKELREQYAIIIANTYTPKVDTSNFINKNYIKMSKSQQQSLSNSTIEWITSNIGESALFLLGLALSLLFLYSFLWGYNFYSLPLHIECTWFILYLTGSHN